MFAEIKNNAVVTFPYDYDTLVKANPHTNFPPNTGLLEMYAGTEANLSGCSLVRVETAPKPFFDAATQDAVLGAVPTNQNGSWVLGWAVQSLTQEQQAAKRDQKAASVRSERTQKLADSDWTQLADSPAEKDAWATYRQALRDMTAQAGFPWEVTWPTQP